MPKPVVDLSQAGKGELHFNTKQLTGKIPHPLIKILVTKLHDVLWKSGYCNVSVTFVSPPAIEETTSSNGKNEVVFKKTGKGYKGPEIQITSLDNKFTGTFALAMTKNGIKAEFPPPEDLLQLAPRYQELVEAKIKGPGPSSRMFRKEKDGFAGVGAGESQETEGSSGFIGAFRPEDAERAPELQNAVGRGGTFGSQDHGGSRGAIGSHGASGSRDGILPGGAKAAAGSQNGVGRGGALGSQDSRGPRGATGSNGAVGLQGSGDPRAATGANVVTGSQNLGQAKANIGPNGATGSRTAPDSKGPLRADTTRFYGTTPVDAKPRGPVPTSRPKASQGAPRAPVPPAAFSTGANGQPSRQGSSTDRDLKGEKKAGCCCFGSGDGKSKPGVQPSGKSDRLGEQRENGGKGGGCCCFGGSGGRGSGGSKPKTDKKSYNKLGEPMGTTGKSERKSKRKSERKSERKSGWCCFGTSSDKAETKRKRKKRGKKNANGGSSGMMAEKSGFYKTKKSKCCCC